MRRLTAPLAAMLLALALSALGAGTAAAQDDAAPASPSIVLPDQPQPSDVDDQPLRLGPCPVPPAPSWSPVEKDAWGSICAGLAANLGAQPKPGSAQQNTQLPPEVLPERRLSTAFLYQILSDPLYAAAITFRGVVIRNADFPEAVNLSYLVLDKPLRLEQSRFFQPLFLRHILSKSEIDLSGSDFRYQPPNDASGPVPPSLDLTEAQIGLSLTLRRIIAGDADLSDIVIGHHVQLDDSTIYGRLYMNGAHIGGMLWLRRVQLDDGLAGSFMDVGNDLVMRFVLAGRPDEVNRVPDWQNVSPTDITLYNSHIQGNLVIGRGVGVAMPPELSVLAREEAERKQKEAESKVVGQTTEVPKVGAIIDEKTDVRFAGQRFDFAVDYLDLGQIHVDGKISVQDSQVGYLNLEDARAGGDLRLTNSEAVDVNMSTVNVVGFLLLQDTTVLRRISLESAEIGRHLAMSTKTVIEKQLHMPSLNVHGSFYANGATVKGPVDMQSAVIGGDLMLTRGATFKAPIDASFARIGQSLDLNGGKFDSVNLTGASIGAELRLVGDNASAEFQSSAVLTLRNARADSLQDVTDVWPENLELVGFNYRQFGGSETPEGPGIPQGSGAQSEQSPAGTAAGHPTKVCSARWWDPISLLLIDRDTEPHDPFKLLCWLEGQKPFSPAPYTQLAGVLRQAGEGESAAAVQYGGRMRHWAERPWGLSKLFSFVPWMLTGFGNYPICSAFWVFVLVGLGMWVFSRDPAPELQSFNPLQLGVYSVDMLMPVVHLRHHHYEIELRSWPRYYLYFHKIAGYVLLTFLAAALIGGGGLE